MEKSFRFFFKDGTEEVHTGHDVNHAFFKTGYPYGCIRAWEEIGSNVAHVEGPDGIHIDSMIAESLVLHGKEIRNPSSDSSQQELRKQSIAQELLDTVITKGVAIVVIKDPEEDDPLLPVMSSHAIEILSLDSIDRCVDIDSLFEQVKKKQ